MWGDIGMAYFWICRRDLAAREFSKVWLIPQCRSGFRLGTAGLSARLKSSTWTRMLLGSRSQESQMKMKIMVFDPGDWSPEGEGSDDALEPESCPEGIEFLEAARALADEVDTEHHGIQAGEAVTWVVMATLALAAPGAVKNVVELGTKLRRFLYRGRSGLSGLERVETNRDGLLCVALTVAAESNPNFYSDPDLIQVLEDGGRYRRDLLEREADDEEYRGFEAGTFLFRIPDLGARRTHIIEMRSDGEVVSHVVRDGLTADALHYLQHVK
jgi:hypothetical protein